MKPVVLAGGSGSRLWPKSRAALPKQFFCDSAACVSSAERPVAFMFDIMARTACPFALAISSGVWAGSVAAAAGAGGGAVPAGVASG